MHIKKKEAITAIIDLTVVHMERLKEVNYEFGVECDALTFICI